MQDEEGGSGSSQQDSPEPVRGDGRIPEGHAISAHTDAPAESATAGGAARFCGSCGAPTGGVGQFCAECGSPLARNAEPAYESVAGTQSDGATHAGGWATRGESEAPPGAVHHSLRRGPTYVVVGLAVAGLIGFFLIQRAAVLVLSQVSSTVGAATRGEAGPASSDWSSVVMTIEGERFYCNVVPHSRLEGDSRVCFSGTERPPPDAIPSYYCLHNAGGLDCEPRTETPGIVDPSSPERLGVSLLSVARDKLIADPLYEGVAGWSGQTPEEAWCDWSRGTDAMGSDGPGDLLVSLKHSVALGTIRSPQRISEQQIDAAFPHFLEANETWCEVNAGFGGG